MFNKIYKEDNLLLSKKLDNESIDLIYADVLYGTNNKEIIDYDDCKFRVPNDAIEFYRPRFIEFHRILKNNGSIYIHCDWHLSHYIKILLDEIFGIENFKNEIIRQCTNAKNNSKNWGRIYDNILFYTKSDDYKWNFLQESKSDADISKQYNKVDDDGRKYTTIALHANGKTNGITGKNWLHPSRGEIKLPSGRHWATSPESLLELDRNNRIYWSVNNVPRKIQYADEYDSKYIQNIWDLRNLGNRESYINRGGLIYNTQKPYELLKRIILQSSNENDIIFDPFVGSGTSCLVAKEHNRNYIGCDISDKSINICKKRGLNIC